MELWQRQYAMVLVLQFTARLLPVPSLRQYLVNFQSWRRSVFSRPLQY